jgi:hypothetical protein
VGRRYKSLPTTNEAAPVSFLLRLELSPFLFEFHAILAFSTLSKLSTSWHYCCPRKSGLPSRI